MTGRLPGFHSPGDADLQSILGAFFSKLDLSPPVPPLVTNKSDKQPKKSGAGGGGGKAKSGASSGAKTNKSAVDAAAQAKIDKEFEPPETPLETVAEPAPQKKEKVILSNPQWGAAKPGFNEETPISVDVLLPEEHAIKTKITFELFAKTPKGSESICSGEAHAKDGKATCSIPVYIPAYKDESGNRMQKVEYYFIAKHSEAEPLDGSAAPKVVDEMAERVLETHILQNVTFVTGKSFIRASEAADLKALGQAVKDWKSKHSDGKLAVFGHADAVGEELSNKALSERRAKSIHAYLAKDPKPWEALYGEEKWGLASVQELLKHLGHDPGTIDGQDGPKTQAAVKEFQGKKGLAATGNADATTREALFLAYFESAGSPGSAAKDFDAIDGKAFTGCSEFNLIENTQGAYEANRRVAVLLLKVSKNFPINYPCKQGSILPCQNQAKLQGARRTAGFKCRFYDGLVVEKKGPVPKPVGKLKWSDPNQGEEVKQYVNLKADKPDQGPERTLAVAIENGSDGTKVYWKITAGKDNSKRNDPKPGVKVDAKGALVEFKNGVAELETEVKGGKASLVLACGLAGGDLYLVEAGTVKGKADIWVSVENWRKLYYEILAPDFMPFEERVESDGSKVMDFSSGMRERIRERLGKAFVEYELFKSILFDEAAAPECSVFKSEQLDLPAGKKGYVLTDHTFKSYPKNFDRSQSPRSIGLKLCNRNYFFEPGSSQLISRILTLHANTFKFKVKNWYGAFFLPKSAADGQDAVKTFKWKALVDPAKFPGHPGVSGGKARQGALDSACIKLITTSEFEIDLPSGSPTDPGSFAGAAETETHCPIEVEIDFEGADEGLGLAGQGAQTGENLVVYNTSSPDSFVDVLLHELGHSMGQTVFSGYYEAPKGLLMPKETGEDDATYAHNGTKGHVYDEKGHSGSHCAYGLSDVDKARASYGGKGGTCIMFGENSGSGASLATTGFCPQCLDYIKARDLRDLTVELQ
jgi:outer membrane protein OmpA-like peptidoglycan-associated protein